MSSVLIEAPTAPAVDAARRSSCATLRRNPAAVIGASDPARDHVLRRARAV